MLYNQLEQVIANSSPENISLQRKVWRGSKGRGQEKGVTTEFPQCMVAGPAHGTFTT